MADVDDIQACMSYARLFGSLEPNGIFAEEQFAVDIRGKIAYCKLTQSVYMDYHDLSAYWAPGRAVTYSEGDAETLAMHTRMNGDNSAIAEWARKGILQWA